MTRGNMENREIEIRRNVVERGLMAAKDFAQKNMRLVIWSVVGLAAAAVLLSAGYLLYDSRQEADLARYERILDDFRGLNPSTDAERAAAVEKTAAELIAASDGAHWGYVSRSGLYVAAGLYFEAGMYEKALESYLKSADRSPRSFFAPLALQQAARSCEALGRNGEAVEICRRLEKDYADSAVADQVAYDAGRLYQMEGDLFKARESFNKVLTLFPGSPFAKKARERLMLLGLVEGKG